MNLADRVLAAAEAILGQSSAGLTTEALTGLVAKEVGRLVPPRQVAVALRGRPQRFIEGGDGRWRLRAAGAVGEEDGAVEVEPDGDSEAAVEPLRRGCYVVFDVEATGQDPLAAETELIQIAAWRWVDGQPEEPWWTFVRPLGPIPEVMSRLTRITDDMVVQAPAAAEALGALFAYAGDLPLVAHNGAGYDGPLVRATCERLGVPLPATFRVLDTLPLARMLLPTEPNHRLEPLAERFGCARPGAHHAEVDVEMLGGIVRGLEGELHSGPSGAAVFELLRRAGDGWAEVLAPPGAVQVAEVVATFGSG